MRILLDNCVVEKYGFEIRGHDVSHARKLGWTGLTNGRLLAAAEQGGFQILLTVDKNLRFQQNMDNRPLVLITIDTHPVTLEGLRAMHAPLMALLDIVETGRDGARNLVLTKDGWLPHK